jgi:protein-S-isoprenylcysteine O-methyltransferase Ste14
MGQGKFENSKKKTKKKNTNKILLRVLIVILSVLLVLMIVVAVSMNYVLGKIGRYDSQQQTEAYSGDHSEFFETDPTVEGQESMETVDPNSVVWDDVETMHAENIINILLVGNDARPGEERAVCTTGVYALCRHPGVLWFAGVYGCLWLTVGLPLWEAALYCGLNVLLVAFEDLCVFPARLEGYDAYRVQTPFLLPTRQSIRACHIKK